MKILWGTPKGATGYHETIITEVEERIPDAIKWAEANGYDRLRVQELDLTLPDFAATVTGVRK